MKLPKSKVRQRFINRVLKNTPTLKRFFLVNCVYDVENKEFTLLFFDRKTKKADSTKLQKLEYAPSYLGHVDLTVRFLRYLTKWAKKVD